MCCVYEVQPGQIRSDQSERSGKSTLLSLGRLEGGVAPAGFTVGCDKADWLHVNLGRYLLRRLPRNRSRPFLLTAATPPQLKRSLLRH